MSVVEEAIWLLELYGSNAYGYGEWGRILDDADGGDGAVALAGSAWRKTSLRGTSQLILERLRFEALEAAARLREGWLP